MDSGEFGTRRDESVGRDNLSRRLTSLKHREVVTFVGGGTSTQEHEKDVAPLQLR